MTNSEKQYSIQFFRQRAAKRQIDIGKISSDFAEVKTQYNRMAEIAGKADLIVDNIETEFLKKTRLNREDLKFLFVGIGLQVIRQYLLNRFYSVRLTHDKSEEKSHNLQNKLWGTDEKNKKEIAEAKNKSRKYHASDSEIMYTYSVPFDAIKGTKTFNVGGKDKGLSGNSHRFNTLGHDPLFGWVFGTGNIMTNTLTNAKMMSFHVKKGEVVGKATTCVMLEEFIERSKNRPKDLGLCVIKEALHLASDYKSKKGIPFPCVQKWFSPEKAQMLAEYGIDCCLIEKTGIEASFAWLINVIIATLHRLTLGVSKGMDERFLEVRTRKILYLSNVIATSSNVIACGMKAVSGDLCGGIKNFDFGGFIITCNRLISDAKYVRNVEAEFLENRYYEMVMDEIKG